MSNQETQVAMTDKVMAVTSATRVTCSPMTTPDFRALCAGLIEKIDYTWGNIPKDVLDLMATARAALAQPEPVPPTDKEFLAMRSWSSHGPTFDSDLVDFGRRCYNLAKQPVSTPYKLPQAGEGEV